MLQVMETDPDIKLQKVSPDLVKDFETSLGLYLNNKSLVRHNKTEYLIKLLEPFQEWPQLLDPHLSRLVPPIISAYLDYLTTRIATYTHPVKHTSNDAIPLPRGLCRLLYTFCKIRGYKVISNFLSNEPKYIEPMLSAYQKWSQLYKPNNDDQPSRQAIGWEERYIMLLWISHFMLTPFDLALISSDQFRGRLAKTSMLPAKLPLIAGYVTQIAIDSLGSPSKERDAARILLVRMVLRPDMHSFGLLEVVLDWTLTQLSGDAVNGAAGSIYRPVGVLSFLAGVVSSADSNVIEPFLQPILRTVQSITQHGNSQQKEIHSSALSRKMVVKIMRAVTVQMLHLQSEDALQLPLFGEDWLEDVIDYLLNSLADKDTLVRLAASKALSIIAAKLDPALAANIVEAVIGSLEEDVLWEDVAIGLTINNQELRNLQSKSVRPNLTTVNSLRWHGLVLTLSQLLFRRSPPADQLPSILNALILALSFEQRSTVGASVGTSVRDSACFGVWSLARRYTTTELLAVDTSSVRAACGQKQSLSILQILANEIIVAACLDSSGNIRRGSSAALQELIGRHPDTIEEGISMVQVVDYHAVALRSRAMMEVCLRTSRLSPLYWQVLLDGLLGFRGIGSQDAQSRRDAATTVGELSRKSIKDCTSLVQLAWSKTTSREIEERHGLTLSLAAILRMIHEIDEGGSQGTALPIVAASPSWLENLDYSEKDFTSAISRPQLIAEACCALISTYGSLRDCSPPIMDIASRNFAAHMAKIVQLLQLAQRRTEEKVIDAVVAATKEVIRASDDKLRTDLIQGWVLNIGNRRARQKPYATIAALSAAYEMLAPDNHILANIVENFLRLLGPDLEIETRVWTIRSLKACAISDRMKFRKEGTSPIDADLSEDETEGHMLVVDKIFPAISQCLDDYTTDQRGDIGSLLRLEAICAANEILQHLNEKQLKPALRTTLLHRLLRLATEKLDKVRNQAWRCLVDNYQNLVPVQ